MTDGERWLWNEWFNDLERYTIPLDHIKYLLIRDKLLHLRMSLLFDRPRATSILLQSLNVPTELSLKQQIAFAQLVGEEDCDL